MGSSRKDIHVLGDAIVAAPAMRDREARAG
jgi:hypothetical protein